jgi:hypothetical protein
VGRSFRAQSSGVKAHGEAREERGLGRHFEGWQPGALAILLAGSSALVAVPQSVDPVEVPVPMIAPEAIARATRADDALAAQAERESRQGKPLDFDVRTLGSAIRAYGLADADGVDTAGDESASRLADTRVVVARRDVALAAGKAHAQGDAALAKLRAYQLGAFLRELRRWDAEGVETKELRALGGGFVAMARKNGWVRHGKLLVDEAARRALFKKRWNELVMTRSDALALTIDEQRALLRLLIRHPPRVDAGDGIRAPQRLSDDERAAFVASQYRLRKIEELAKIDPAYPADFARGVVLYQMRRFASATEMFRRHLDAHPDGPLTLRARNHLKASLAHASDEAL